MTIGERIRVCMAPGEADREQDLRIALSHDPRFDPLQIDSSIPVDLRFGVGCEEYDSCPDAAAINRPDCIGKCDQPEYFNMELKRPEDFVQSVLNGHLMDQTLSIRESGYNGCTVILGGLDDLYEAIKDASKLRAGKYLRGAELGQAISSTHLRCKSFRKRSFLNGIPIFHKGDDSGFFDSDDQWKDILNLAYDYLLDGDMLGFRQRPANGERELLAASILFHGDGVGPGVLKPVMNEYKLALVPKGEYARQPLDMAGIGPKRAKLIEERIVMHYGR